MTSPAFTLLIPALTPPDPAWLEGLELPALATLLARGVREDGPVCPVEAWLGGAFQLPPPLPAAALSLLGDGGDPGTARWLRADPVHLAVGRDGVWLAGLLTLDEEESRKLGETFSAHFAQEGLTLETPTPGRWYLPLPDGETWSAPPPAALLGQRLPRPGGGAWARRMGEIQMLLHDHPVNAAREARGEYPVNALWLWGEGALPDTLPRPWERVFSDDPLVMGLAWLAGLPTSGSSHFRPEGHGTALAVLDTLRAPAALGDAHGWRAALARLEADWFAPALGASGGLALVVPETGRRWTLTPAARWRFWMRPSLAALG